MGMSAICPGQMRLWRLDADVRWARLKKLQQKLQEAETELGEAEKDMEELHGAAGYDDDLSNP